MQPEAVFTMENGAVIRVLLLPESAPNAVSSFIFAARRGVYDGHAIERIVPGNWIDLSYSAFHRKDAMYLLPKEYDLHPETEPLTPDIGTMCMGGYGDLGLAGCEVFFPLRACPEFKGVYPVLGKVLEGMEELRRLEKVKTVPVTDFPIPGVEINEPVEPQRIRSCRVDTGGVVWPEPVRAEGKKLPPCWKA